MGALLFMGLMFALLCFGGFLLLLGLVFLYFRYRGKKKGTQKKWYTVLAGIFLVLGVGACTLPVGYWLFLRTANSSMDKGYVNTGKMVDGGFQDGTFTVDGVTYERLEMSRSGLCPRGEAVFSWDSGTAWEHFFGYYNRGNYFAVENALGLDLICDDGGYSRLWCRSDQLAQANAWYGDKANYQWYLHNYDYDTGDRSYTLLESLEDRSALDSLLELAAEEQEGEEFTFPRETEIPEYHLVSISTDHVASKDNIYLAVYDDQLCLMGTQTYAGDTRTDTAYPLPIELSDYFSDLLNIRGNSN